MKVTIHDDNKWSGFHLKIMSRERIQVRGDWRIVNNIVLIKKEKILI
jgi:hypothetical protein